MLQVRDTVGVEEGQMLGVFAWMVTLGDWERVGRGLRVRDRVATRVVGLGDKVVVGEKVEAVELQSKRRLDTAVPGAGDADGTATGAVIMPLNAFVVSVLNDVELQVSAFIFTILLGDMAYM